MSEIEISLPLEVGNPFVVGSLWYAANRECFILTSIPLEGDGSRPGVGFGMRRKQNT